VYSNSCFSASHSQWGVSPDLHIKPDIAGPGGNIYSTYVTNISRYAVVCSF
jgi:hypothetical protein